MNGDDSFTSKSPPSAAFVNWFLAQGDTQSAKSPLHRLGTKENDAAPGNHKHDGRTSQYLFDPAVDIVHGDLSTLAGVRLAVKELLVILRKVGITDQTTN